MRGTRNGTGLDLAAAVDGFPDSIRHWSGVVVPRDKTRLLLHFREPGTREYFNRLFQSGALELEPDPPEAPGKVVLHTATEAWVRSRSREPLEGVVLMAAGLRFGPDLGWVGAVFRAPGPPDAASSASDSLERLYVSFPHSLRVFPAPGFAGNPGLAELVAALERRSLAPVPGDTSMAAGLGLRWTGRREDNVYGLEDSLPAWEPEKIEDAALENAPMLFPG